MKPSVAILYAGSLFGLVLAAAACLPGGIIREGGYANHVQLIPTATRTRGAGYRIICQDQDEIKRRTALKKRRDLEIRTARKEGGKPPPALDLSGLNPPYRLVSPVAYRGECDQQGQHSVFYLFHFVRVTPPLDPERAISEAVQRFEGDTMVGIHAWHETHYYSIIGVARVFKVRGAVIKFNSPTDTEQKEKSSDPAAGGRR